MPPSGAPTANCCANSSACKPKPTTAMPSIPKDPHAHLHRRPSGLADPFQGGLGNRASGRSMRSGLTSATIRSRRVSTIRSSSAPTAASISPAAGATTSIATTAIAGSSRRPSSASGTATSDRILCLARRARRRQDPGSRIPRQPAGRRPATFIRYHGNQWLDDLSLVAINQGGRDVWRLAPAGFDAHGNPIFKQWQKLLTDPVFEARAQHGADAIHGGNELADTFSSDWAMVDGAMTKGSTSTPGAARTSAPTKAAR